MAIGIGVQAVGTTIQREVYIAAIAGESWCTDMYEELVKELRGEYGYDSRVSIRVMKAAAEAIEELQGKHFLMKKTAEWLAEKVPTWVPITERLPSAHELVLIYNPGYPMTTGFLYEDGRWKVRGVDYPDTPTHWMPLPELPKEGGA